MEFSKELTYLRLLQKKLEHAFSVMLGEDQTSANAAASNGKGTGKGPRGKGAATLLTREIVAWAHGVVWTRGCYFPQGSCTSCLVPFGDYLNHHPDFSGAYNGIVSEAPAEM